MNGPLYFTLPKGSKTRTVDMSESVAQELRTHVEDVPRCGGGTPLGEPGKPTKKFSLLLTTRFANAIAVNTFNTYVWKPALARIGVIPPRLDGAKPWQWEAAHRDSFHVLRHTYASAVLEAGESVVTLAKWLGHSSPTITLDHYAHFMPEAGGRGRRAIDGLLSGRGTEVPSPNPPDSPQG
ncbi:tyrosine-type recombinase/integrase [Streptomyces maoxianensis]|uniref:Tyrosine-type recombinase/integrase n=1 Tax=Streptomyces maoxianensis TaxID=1459942 RepID=A0ABV9GD40_9ACTN